MIEEFIPAGYENRISREALHEMLHVSDRAIRHMIEEAQERNIPIISDDGGYFIYNNTRDDDHMMAYMLRENARFLSMSHKNKLLRSAWATVHRGSDGQMSLFEEVG